MAACAGLSAAVDLALSIHLATAGFSAQSSDHDIDARKRRCATSSVRLVSCMGVGLFAVAAVHVWAGVEVLFWGA